MTDEQATRILHSIMTNIRFLDGECASYLCDAGMFCVRVEKRNTENLPCGTLFDAWVFQRSQDILSTVNGPQWVEDKINKALQSVRVAV